MKPFIAILLVAAMSASPALAQQPAPDSQLCHSQLELLVSGDKLTAEERQQFEAQCKCLEEREQGQGVDAEGNCAAAAS